MASNAKDSKEYYKLLGLTPGAPVEDVKKAFNKKQAEYHPNGPARKILRDSSEYKAMNDEQKKAKEAEIDEISKKVNEAYKILSDKNKKNEYDSGTGEFGGFGGSGFGGGFSGFDGFADIFTYMAGGMAGGAGERQRSKVKDVECVLKLEIKDAFLGKKSKFRVKTTKLCKTCTGKGGKDVSNCGKCKGTGFVYAKFNLGIVSGSQQVMCPECEGKGSVVKGPACSECNGRKVVDENKIIEVNIKPGIEDGDTIVYTKQGNEYPGYGQGDIVFNISIEYTPKSFRIGNDYVCEVDLDIHTAIVGGILYYDHPDGKKLSIKVDPFKDFDNNAIIVPGSGFPSSKGVKGRLIIKPHIIIGQNVDRAKLAEFIRPQIQRPSGDYINTNSTLGKAPEVRFTDSEREYSRRSGEASSGFGFDDGRFSSFFN
ncbi:Type I HSP40 co-chaperone [Glugoides intestinalis]